MGDLRKRSDLHSAERRPATRRNRETFLAGRRARPISNHCAGLVNVNQQLNLAFIDFFEVLELIFGVSASVAFVWSRLQGVIAILQAIEVLVVRAASWWIPFRWILLNRLPSLGQVLAHHLTRRINGRLFSTLNGKRLALSLGRLELALVKGHPQAEPGVVRVARDKRLRLGRIPPGAKKTGFPRSACRRRRGRTGDGQHQRCGQ